MKFVLAFILFSMSFIKTEAACATSGEFYISIKPQSTIHASEQNASVTITLTPISNYSFKDKGNASVVVYYDRWSSCFPQNCGSIRQTLTATQPDKAFDTREVSFTYNQNSFSTQRSDFFDGYNFSYYVEATIGGKTICASASTSINRIYRTAYVIEPQENQCYTTNPITFKINDMTRPQDMVYTLDITGPGSYSKSYEFLSSSFSGSNYSITIDQVTTNGNYNWVLYTRRSNETKDLAVVSKNGKFRFNIADFCNVGPKTTYPVLLPGEKPPYRTGTTPLYKIYDIQKLLQIEPCDKKAAGNYLITRKDHLYTMDFGDGVTRQFTTAQANATYLVDNHAYQTLNSTGYTYTWKVTYTLETYTTLGQLVSRETKNANLNTFVTKVAEIKVRTKQRNDFVPVNTIQEAFSLCNNESGGEIFVNNSYNNTTNNIIDLSPINQPILLYVRNPQGYIVNGSYVSAFYNGNMNESAEDIYQVRWYSVSLKPITLFSVRNYDGPSSDWLPTVNVSSTINLSNFSHSTGTINYVAGNSINILSGTTLNSSATLSVKPDLY